MSVSLGLGQYAVFSFALRLDANPMLSQPAEQIFAFPDIDDLVVNADLVDAWALKLFVPALTLQHRVYIVFIGVF